MRTLLHNALIVNEGKCRKGSVMISGERIEAITYNDQESDLLITKAQEVINCAGLWLLPGCIDDQVHFRDPGLTHKGDIESESRAAVAGGITSFMDMPNTLPTTTTIEALRNKQARARDVSWANYAFFFGGTNDNIKEIHRLPPEEIPGLKLFLGASTGNMLIDNRQTLERIFSECNLLIATHCENESIIRSNKKYYTEKFGQELDISFHPLIRSAEACYRSSAETAELADRFNARLHILHISSARELALFRNDIPLSQKRLTAEVCIHHLWFSDADYKLLENRIKWNPAIKTLADREALREALRSDLIDIVATDHAPHLLTEKAGSCIKAASGGPLAEHSLLAMLELSRQDIFSITLTVEKMAHRPAELFGISDRGYIRPGYYADIVLVDPEGHCTVKDDQVLSRCGWSPFNNYRFTHSIHKVWVNGHLAAADGCPVDCRPSVHPLVFNR